MSFDPDDHVFVSKRWDNDKIDIDVNDIKVKVSINTDNLIKFKLDSNEEDKDDNDDWKEIMSVFEENEAQIYLEWTDKYTGQYKYYDLNHIIKELESTSISPNNLYKHNSITNIKAQDLDLKVNDIMILSKMRDLYQRNAYTFMGKFGDKQISIYLGEWPKVKYMKKLDIYTTVNCCRASADEISDCIKYEIQFDVANWKSLLIQELAELKKANKTLNKSKQLKKLDQVIDDINNKAMVSSNCYIHCHAGMHRSPFIVGCFLIKYGGYTSKSIKDIYSFMTAKRDCVETMGYDKTMEQYKEYLAMKQNQSNNRCTIL